MTKFTATLPLSLLADEEGYDPIEDRLRSNIQATIEVIFEEELASIKQKFLVSAFPLVQEL